MKNEFTFLFALTPWLIWFAANTYTQYNFTWLLPLDTVEGREWQFGAFIILSIVSLIIGALGWCVDFETT